MQGYGCVRRNNPELGNGTLKGAGLVRYHTKALVGFIAMLLFLAVLGGVAAAQGFSADVVTYYGQETMKGKIFATYNKMRLESGGTISITRQDKKLVWLLMPTEKMYMEQSIRLQNLIPGTDLSADEMERTLLGSEMVNSYQTQKYRVTLKIDRQKQTVLEWLAADSGLPVKMATEDGKWVQEYRNVVTGDPDPGLFEIPANYTKFGMCAW